MLYQDITWIEILSFIDERGSLSTLDKSSGLPFEIKRIYYLYEVKDKKTRGHHAHINLEQIFIAISGSFNLTLDNGVTSKTFKIDQPNKALYVPKMTWRVLSDFSSNAVCLVLASEAYNKDDYIYSYEDFKQHVMRNS